MFDHESTVERLRRNGAACGELLLPGEDWIRRRVERISFVDRRLVRRHVSIDFSVPKTAEWRLDKRERLIPISMIAKWPPLLNFDLRDGEKALPLLTTTENACMDEAALLSIAKRLRGADSDLPNQIHRLTHDGQEKAVAALRQIAQYLQCLDSSGGTRDRLLNLAKTLSESSILWVPTRESVGTRVLVKFAYDQPTEGESGRLLRTVTGRRNRYYMLPHLGHAGSYHLEVNVPDVVTVKSADLLVPGPGEAGSGPETQPPDWAEDAHTQIADRRAHLYIGRRRREASWGFFLLHTAVARNGSLWSAWATSAMITGLLAFYWLWAEKIVTVNSAAITTLLLVPTVLGYLLVRPDEHPMTREHLAFSRVIVLLSGILPVLAAIALVAAGARPEVSAVDYWWRDLAIVGGVFTFLLTVSLAAASSTDSAGSE